jgi:hypothetical protein
MSFDNDAKKEVSRLEEEAGKTVAELYQERETRVREAIELKEPDRVPVIIRGENFAARYADLPLAAVYYDPASFRSALKRTILELEPDMGGGPGTLAASGPALEMLGMKQLLWPGGPLHSNVTHQFVEAEYMREEEYDLFITDPTDFVLRYYLPRVFASLRPLSGLASIMPIQNSAAFPGILHRFGTAEMGAALETLHQAGQEQEKWRQALADFEEEMARLGFPLASHANFGGAPFDAISDYLRGMRGTMLDMYRCPDKLLAACERIMDWRIARASSADPDRRGNPKRAGGAILRGSDGFMSKEQFDRFYWPGLKRTMESTIDLGFVPFLFCEGACNSRLEYFLDLPRGKFVLHFDETDMRLAKAVLGSHCCIMGNVPASLLSVGSPAQVEEYCRSLFRVAGKGGGFILTSGGFLDDAKPANVKAMIDSAKKYGRY